MNQISTVPLLAAGLGMFGLLLTVRSYRRGLIGAKGAVSVTLWLGALGIWGFISASLALSGLYRTQAFYANLSALWLPLVPFALTAAFAAASPSFRHAVLTIAEHHTREFILVQALRAAALGTLVKAYLGTFPAYFALLVGIPDFLFGLSAIALLATGYWTALVRRGLVAWNLIGIAVILPAPALIQLGMPGPLSSLTGVAGGEALYAYPMVLAPTLVVAFFVIMNAIQAAAAWLCMDQTMPCSGGECRDRQTHMHA